MEASLPWELWAKEIVSKCSPVSRFVLRHLSRQFYALLRSDYMRRNYMIDFAEMDSLALLQWGREGPWPSLWSVDVSGAACASSSVELIAYLARSGCPFNSKATRALADRNDIGVIKALMEVDKALFKDISSFYKRALELRNLELFKYYVEELGLNLSVNMVLSCCDCSGNGIFEYMQARNSDLAFTKFRDVDIHIMFARGGLVELSKAAMASGISLSPRSRLYSEAAKNNRIQYMDFLYEEHLPLKDTSDMIKAVQAVITGGYEETLRWFIAHDIDVFDMLYDEWNYSQKVSVAMLDLAKENGFPFDLARRYAASSLGHRRDILDWTEACLAALPSPPPLDVSYPLQLAILRNDETAIDKYLTLGSIMDPTAVFVAAVKAKKFHLMKRFAPETLQWYRISSIVGASDDLEVIKFFVKDLKLQLSRNFLAECVKSNPYHIAKFLLESGLPSDGNESLKFTLLNYHDDISGPVLGLIAEHMKGVDLTEAELKEIKKKPCIYNWLVRRAIICSTSTQPPLPYTLTFFLLLICFFYIFDNSGFGKIGKGDFHPISFYFAIAFLSSLPSSPPPRFLILFL